jgi:hypothetical protein
MDRRHRGTPRSERLPAAVVRDLYKVWRRALVSPGAGWTEGLPIAVVTREDSNLVSEHKHIYEVKDYGSNSYAECECGHKFNRGNGVVIGSRRRIELEIA